MLPGERTKIGKPHIVHLSDPALAEFTALREKSGGDLTIDLTKTTDILEAATGDFVKVGFAAETQNLIANAKVKVGSKNLDLIVANDLTDPDSGFGVDTNKVTLIDRDLNVDELPVLTKYEVGHRILDRVSKLLGEKASN